MKIFCALLLFCLAAGAAPPSGTVTFAWGYQQPIPTNITFRLYMTTNLAPANWQVVTNTPFPQTTVKIVKQSCFFAVTALDSTNFWAESDFSNVLPVTDPPRPGQNLSVVRGQ